jgi:hypothetical protein
MALKYALLMRTETSSSEESREIENGGKSIKCYLKLSAGLLHPNNCSLALKVDKYLCMIKMAICFIKSGYKDYRESWNLSNISLQTYP